MREKPGECQVFLTLTPKGPEYNNYREFSNKKNWGSLY